MREVRDLFAREDRVRTPVKGLRTRLRTALRAAGYEGKFRTDHLRNGTLVVIMKEPVPLPFTTFDDHEVKLMRKS